MALVNNNLRAGVALWVFSIVAAWDSNENPFSGV